MNLHVETMGAGPDVVLLHGWGMHAGTWGGFARSLARSLRVHAVDLPGYGASAPCAPCTLDRIAAVLAANLPARCFVCGWSLGGQVALTWARQAPQQVAGLGLVATTPCFARRDDWAHAVDAGVLREFALALAADCEDTLKRFLALQVLGDARAFDVAARLRREMRRRRRAEPEVLNAGLRILLESDLRDALPAISQPALVVHGERDRLAPPAAGEYLSRRLPHATLALIPGAAHVPFLSNPRLVSALLVEFCNGR